MQIWLRTLSMWHSLLRAVTVGSTTTQSTTSSKSKSVWRIRLFYISLLLKLWWAQFCDMFHIGLLVWVGSAVWLDSSQGNSQESKPCSQSNGHSSVSFGPNPNSLFLSLKSPPSNTQFSHFTISLSQIVNLQQNIIFPILTHICMASMNKYSSTISIYH